MEPDAAASVRRWNSPPSPGSVLAPNSRHSISSSSDSVADGRTLEHRREDIIGGKGWKEGATNAGLKDARRDAETEGVVEEWIEGFGMERRGGALDGWMVGGMKG